MGLGLGPAMGGGVTQFIQLSDAPHSYAGQSLMTVRVNAGETGLEFYYASGAGDMVGPSSSTDNAVVRFDSTSGKLTQNSVVLIGDTGAITGVSSITVNNTGLLIKDTDASHTLAIVPGSNLTADRTLTINTGDSTRSLTLGGNVAFAAGFSTSGSNSLTLTTTGSTNVTLPTSGTVATTSNSLSDFAVPSANLAMNSKKITGLANGVSAQDAATMSNLDAVASGLLVKASCRLATTANLVGSYVGTPTFTLTETGFGALTIDGVAANVNDRILVKNQTTGTQNGIYTVTDAGSGGTSWVLTRATDFDADAEILTGDYTFIVAGTTNAGYGFYLTTPATITLDTTALTFTQFSSSVAYTAGDGLILTGTTLAVGAGTGITVAADAVSVDFTAVQAKDATLTALASYNTNGLLTQTAADTFAGRTITGSNGVSVSNGNGVSGNPALQLDITGLTEETVVDTAADFAVIYDTSATANRKVELSNLLGATSGGLYRWKQQGTATMECWYSNQINAGAATTGSQSIDGLKAFPFYPGVTGVIDRLAFYITTAGTAGSVGRVGIYTSTSATNIYPDALVVETGELVTSSVGAKVATISANLQGDTLYWLVFIFGVAAPTLRAGQAYEMPMNLGFTSALSGSATTGLYSARAYGALPATFPAGASVLTSNPALGYIRYA